MNSTKEILPYFNRHTKTIYLNTLKNNYLVLKVFPELSWKNVNIFMTAITEEESLLINNYLKQGQAEEVKIDIQKQFPRINLKGIIANGNGNEKATSFGSVLQLKKSNSHSSSAMPRYRNYEVSYEKWNENPYVNLCPESRMSYESVLRKLGAKGVHGMNNKNIPFYTVLWISPFTSHEETISRNGL